MAPLDLGVQEPLWVVPASFPAGVGPLLPPSLEVVASCLASPLVVLMLGRSWRAPPLAPLDPGAQGPPQATSASFVSWVGREGTMVEGVRHVLAMGEPDWCILGVATIFLACCNWLPSCCNRLSFMLQSLQTCCIRVLDMLRVFHVNVSKLDLNIFYVENINF
jgi:hypothetical protein